MAGFNNDTMFAQIGSDVGVFPNTSSSDNSTEFDRPGDTVSSIVNNVSDDALSDSQMKIRVNSSSSGVPYQVFTVGNDISWSVGINTVDFSGEFFSINRDDSSNVSPVTGIEKFRMGTITAIYSLRQFIVEDNPQTTFVESIVRNTDTTNNAAAGVRNTLSTSSDTADVYHLLSVPQGAAPGDRTWEQGVSSSNAGRVEWRSPINAALPGLAGTLRLAMTTAGERTLPTNPAFLAQLSATDFNVTGNGAVFQIGSGNVFTIIYNQGSHFTTAGVFTAPVTGRYLFCATFDAGNVTATYSSGTILLIASNRTIVGGRIDPGSTFDTLNRLGFGLSTFMDMDASDTCTINMFLFGGGMTVNVEGNTGPAYFSGYLAC